MPTVSTEVEICNSALIKVGSEIITSLDEDNKRAQACKERYSKIRDEVLTAHPWNFAITRKELAKSATYSPPFEYDNAFVMPTDVLRVIRTDLNLRGSRPETQWSIEADPDTKVKVMVTNADAVSIRYIFSQTDVTQYSPTFVEVLATRLAVDLAYHLIQSTTMQAQLFSLYTNLLRDARTYDAQENHVEEVEAYDWLNSRF